MKNLCILCLTILLCHTANAQNKIEGFITDQHQQPLVGATVFIQDMQKGTVTDHAGKYELQHLPSGTFRLQFSYLGFSNQIKTVTLKQETVHLNIQMNETIIEAEEVIISGGYNTTQHENSIKIEVLPLKNDSKATPNFTERLTKVPGVDMISKGSGVSKPVIRGLSMNDILVLNHGVRYENYQYSSHHPLGIDEFGIETIEIIKGPASLLYGSDAIGGVVNFIKEKPATVGTIIGDYNLQLHSNTLGMTNNMGIKGASEKYYAGIRVGHKTNADYLQGGGSYVPNTRFNEYSIKSNLGFTMKLGNFNLFYDYNKANLGLAEEEAIEQITQRGRKNELYYQQLNTHLLSSRNNLFLGNYKLAINAAYQHTELIHFDQKDSYELQMQLPTLTYETKLYLPSTKQSTYIIGLQGMHQRNINTNDRETVLLPNATTNNYSAFGLFQYTLFSKLKLQAGLRYDYKTILTKAVGTINTPTFRPVLDKSYSSFSGSLGATYSLSDQLLLRANIAAAYRTPNLAELTSNGKHELRYEIGNADLLPENAYEGDVSLHYHHPNFTIDIAGFYNHIHNYIYISPTGENAEDKTPIYRYRQATSYLLGGEAGMHVHPEKTPWLHFETTFASVIGKQTNGTYLPFIPANKLQVELRIVKEKLWLLQNTFASSNVQIAFDQNHPAPDETATNGYALLNVAVGGEFLISKQPVIVSLSVNNLLDKAYTDHLSTLKEVNRMNPGRNIALGLSIPFTIKSR